MREIQSILHSLAARPTSPAVLATLVEVQGSSYRKPGARMLWFPDGTRLGSVSGGCLEDDIGEHARDVLQRNQPKIVTYDTTEENDLVWGTGTGCDGRIKLVLEPIPVPRPAWVQQLAENYAEGRETRLAITYHGDVLGTRAASSELSADDYLSVIAPPQPLVVFGAGDDAQPLVRMAAELGWRVTVIDSRPAYATSARFPEAHTILSGPLGSLLADMDLEAAVPRVVMTHRYLDDRAILHAALPHAQAYVGVLGPRKRTQRLLAEIESAGGQVSAASQSFLHAPVGLNLGGSSAETVALSILAEIQSWLAKAKPIALRDKPGPIHA